LRHVLLDRWSQGTSPLHRRDARVKILALLVFLIVLATTPANAALILPIYAALLVSAILIARLPLARVLLRASIVLPFSLTFAFMSWLAGEPLRALALVEKSYLSTIAVLLVAGTTPLPLLLGALEKLGTPQLLVLVAQFLYRYLFVLADQARNMRLAASCRTSSAVRRHKLGFRAATGALAVLFARSYQRADGIHRAMQARGFSGRFSMPHSARLRASDGLFLLVVSLFLLLVRVA
jgi:cobalt/nickel transport system permease protein